VALQLSHTAAENRGAKRAFSGTEAALQVATYRLNNVVPDDGQCATGVASAPAGGVCTAEGNLGEGGSWKYHMTPVLSDGRCAGLPVESSTESGVAPRCITAEATSNGVTRRVQARLAGFLGLPIFPLHGILGINGVELKNSATVDGFLGSNGLIQLQNSSAQKELHAMPHRLHG
jgi:hypothetical protein